MGNPTIFHVLCLNSACLRKRMVDWRRPDCVMNSGLSDRLTAQSKPTSAVLRSWGNALTPIPYQKGWRSWALRFLTSRVQWQLFWEKKNDSLKNGKIQYILVMYTSCISHFSEPHQMRLFHHIPSPGKIGQDLGRLSLRPGLRWRNPFPMHHQPGEGRLRHQGSARRRWRELRCIRCFDQPNMGVLNWVRCGLTSKPVLTNQKSGGEIWKYWQRGLDWQSCVNKTEKNDFSNLLTFGVSLGNPQAAKRCNPAVQLGTILHNLSLWDWASNDVPCHFSSTHSTKHSSGKLENHPTITEKTTKNTSP